MGKRLFSLLLILGVVLSFTAGRVITWTGRANNSDQNWHNVANWDTETIPTIEDDVVISLKERYDIYLYDTAPTAYARSLVLNTAEIIATGQLVVNGPVTGNMDSQLEALSDCSFGDVNVDTFLIQGGITVNVSKVETKSLFVLSGTLHINGQSSSTTKALALSFGQIEGMGATLKADSIVLPAPQFYTSTTLPKSLLPVREKLVEVLKKSEGRKKVNVEGKHPDTLYTIVSGVQVTGNSFYMSKLAGEQDLLFINGGTITSGV